MSVERSAKAGLAAFFIALTASGCESDRGREPTAPDTYVQHTIVQAPPPDYYDSVDGSSPTSLRQSLHEVIDDHTRFPYTASSTDTWDILELADEDPNNSNNILDVYRNTSYGKQGGGNAFYNREHTWPKSYGFPNDNDFNYPYTDCHHLFLSDADYNTERSNKPYRLCDGGCSEFATEANNNQGGGSGVYPGNSNWTSGLYTEGTWETWLGRRGDVARAAFYMDVRYEGGVHNVTGASEPDLILTNDEALIDASRTGNNEDVGYMGMVSVLLQWHLEDPVDDIERSRNDIIYSFQGNRNPFIDNPEWADCIYLGACAGSTLPAVPVGLVASGGDGSVGLDWDDNSEPDLAGYNVFRSTAMGGPYTQLNGSLVAASSYDDNAVTNNTTYYYVVTAVDTDGDASAYSAEASATPGVSGGPTTVWINELHYDDSSRTTSGFVELAGTAGLDLSGWQLVGYAVGGRSGSGVYNTLNLSGVIPNQQASMGTLSFNFNLQDGAPSGIALIDDTGSVVELLSYEGTLTATSGPAAGMTSTDIGVSESSTTPQNYSLQKAGSGSTSTDFTWQPPQPSTPGTTNTGQSFSQPVS